MIPTDEFPSFVRNEKVGAAFLVLGWPQNKLHLLKSNSALQVLKFGTGEELRTDLGKYSLASTCVFQHADPSQSRIALTPIQKP